MNREELQERNKAFVLFVIECLRGLPRSEQFRIISKQLLRSATSVGANYRAARRARSKSAFYSKICIVVEEIDEANYWIDLICELLPKNQRVKRLYNESEELLKIYAAMRRSLRSKL